MQFTDTRDIDPDAVNATVIFSEAELHAAFSDGTPESQALFFQLYGPGWEAEAVSEKLQILSEVALRAEQAVSLNLTSGSPEPQ